MPVAEGAGALRLGAVAAADATVGAGSEDVLTDESGPGANHDPPAGGERPKVAADVGSVAPDPAGELPMACAGDDDAGVGRHGEAPEGYVERGEGWGVRVLPRGQKVTEYQRVQGAAPRAVG